MHPLQALEQALQAYPWQPPITLKRHDFLFQKGQLVPYIYRVESGALRAVLFQENEEVTLRLGYRGSMVAALHCLYAGQAAEFSIQALRKCVVRPLSWQHYLQFLEAAPEHRALNQRLMESLILEQTEREIDLLTSLPAERYQRVVRRSPQLFQEVPKKYIANYLRMSPETLSRLMHE